MKKNMIIKIIVLLVFTLQFQVLGKTKLALWGDGYVPDTRIRNVVYALHDSITDWDFITHVGDMTLYGREEDWQKQLGFQPFKDLFEGKDGKPFLLCTSNHEATYNDGNSANWNKFTAGILPTNDVDGTTHFYHYTHKTATETVHVFACDDYWTDEKVVEEWLKKELATVNPNDWIIGLWHNPGFDDMSYKGGYVSTHGWIKVLAEAGGDFIFNGHAHIYHRTHILDANGDVLVDCKSNVVSETRPKGMVHIINGATGAGLNPDQILQPNHLTAYTPGIKVESWFTTITFEGNKAHLKTYDAYGGDALTVEDEWEWTQNWYQPVDPAFTSDSTITVKAGESKGYKVKYNNALCSVVLLKKPSWTLIRDDSVGIYAPKNSCVDSMVFQLKNSSGTPVDTLVLKITVTGGVGIVNNGSETNVLGISPQISSGKSGFNITLPIAGKYSVYVYDINGKEVWKYQSVASVAGNQYVTWGNIVTNRKILKNKIYFAVLRQGNKKVSVKLNFVL